MRSWNHALMWKWQIGSPSCRRVILIKQLLNLVIAKYPDLSVSFRSIICLSLRLRHRIELLANDKYFAQPRSIIVTNYSVFLCSRKWQFASSSRNRNKEELNCHPAQICVHWTTSGVFYGVFKDRSDWLEDPPTGSRLGNKCYQTSKATHWVLTRKTCENGSRCRPKLAEKTQKLVHDLRRHPCILISGPNGKKCLCISFKLFLFLLHDWKWILIENLN